MYCKKSRIAGLPVCVARNKLITSLGFRLEENNQGEITEN